MSHFSFNVLHWPIVLKQCDQAELIYLSQLTELTEQLAIQASLEELTIIDSQGYCYHPQPCDSDIQLHLFAPQPSLQQLIDWVRQHASQAGHCCTTKLSANNIEQLFAILAFIEEA
ncbi:DUF4144 family protein [Shewanella fidelis]|uniref:DUF4144 family protein n=1 Tax=Shewanella fidelis TaxID=173509 RepID=UPI0004920C45|nr:DUF4144 family protein [Shewanella fidelis]